MKCPRCNTDLVDDAHFCGICGSPLSISQDNATQVSPFLTLPDNNEATLMAASWPGAQPIQGPQAQPSVPQSSTNNATPPVRQAPASAQPGSLFSTQAVPSWQQPPQASGPSFTLPPAAYPPGMALGTMNSVGVIPARAKRKRGGRILSRFFLVLVLLLAILAGAWFFGVRPYLHGLVQTQLDNALSGAESQMVLFQVALPSGGQIVHVDESSMNTYLSARNVSPLQNLHATITPGGLRMDFSAYGFTSDIILVPVAVESGLQVTNVQVQGVLWLVMSSDELTTALNSNFQSFGQQMTRKIQSITLHEHEMDVQIQ